jgi:hypothetical protein
MPNRTSRTILACILSAALAGCRQQQQPAAAPVQPQANGESSVKAAPKVAPKQDVIDVWASESTPKQRLLRLLTPRTETADVLTIFSPPDLVDIAARMKAAMQKDPIGAIGTAFHKDADGVMKYDPRMGVTKEEYERFLQGPKLLKLVKTGEAQIVIENRNDTVRITGLPKLDEIVFDAAKLSVKTPYGSLENGQSFAPNDQQFLTGKIAGFSWRNASISALILDEFTLWTVMLAQSQENRDVWLSVRVKNNQTRQDQFNYFFNFPGPRQ